MSLLKGTRITWLGHSTVLVQTARDTNILIDPFIKENLKYPRDFELPAKIDAILVTHGHGDHSADVAPVAATHDSPVVAVFELATYFAGKGVGKTMGMNLGGTVQIGEVAVTMVEAKHSSSVQDEQGTHCAGVAAGYVLTIDGGPVLYHAGDTSVFGDMKLIGELYRPQVAMLPIGGNYTMGCREAALAASLLESNTILPIHFGTFPEICGGSAEKLATQIGSGAEVVRRSPGEAI